MSGPLSNILQEVEKFDADDSFQRKYFKFNVTRFRHRLSAFKASYPRSPLVLFSLGIFLGWESYAQKRALRKAEEEISFRKTQLSQPIHEVGANAVEFPWTNENLQEWLYRPVRISGRPIHAKAKLIPREKYGHHGYDYIVPLVTSEKPDGSQQHGVLLNLGWMPHQWKYVSSRYRIEDASLQTFEAYVSLNSELEHRFGDKGNAPALARNKWNTADLELMAKNCNFVNVEKAQVALLERVNLHTPLDERNMEHYDHDASYTQDYPHSKTKPGALQLYEMPWDHKRKAEVYRTGSAALALVAAGLALI